MRNAPDIAMDADFHNYNCQSGSCSGGWGGTSFSAPRMAGFMALVNQQAAAQGKPPLGYINPTLYSIGKGSNYHSNFHDIVPTNALGISNAWINRKSNRALTGGAPRMEFKDLAGLANALT